MNQITISAKDVAELRARTGAGMMDCKKALEEAQGDMARAMEILRARGIAKAEKRAGRSTSQGLVAGLVSADATSGALLELTCETDFVARNEDFQAAAEALLARLAAGAPVPTEEFVAGVQDRITELTAKTGENVTLRNAVKMAPGATGTVGLYLHHNRQVGVLVEVEGTGPAAQELARELALHVASADPIAVRGEDIPAEVVERERRIATEQVEQEGKPEAVRAKIVEGKIKKFLAERALLNQPWVKDDKKPVSQLVDEYAKQAGAPLVVKRFVRLKVGEG